MRKVTVEEVDVILASCGFVRDGDYVGTTQKPTALRCKTCDYTWRARINSIQQGFGCPNCSGNAPVTVEKVDATLMERGVVRDGDYVGTTHKPTPLRCNKCDHTWCATMSSIQQGRGCPNCAGKAPVPVVKVDAILADRGFVRNGDYVGVVNKPTPLRCNTCTHTWRTTMTHIQKGSGCPHCAGVAPVTVRKIDDTLSERGFVRDGDYVGSTNRPTSLRCKACDHTWRATVSGIKRGRGCPNCAGTLPVTVEKVDVMLAERGFVRDGDYAGNTKKRTSLRCKTCEYTWNTTINNIQQGTGCPNCARDRLQPNGIYHLYHPDISHQYIGISWKPKSRLKQHQEDQGPRGVLARELQAPYECTVEEVYNLLQTADAPPDVALWASQNPFGRIDYAGTIVDTPWDKIPPRVKSKPARVPRFVAEWIETELIRQLSVNYPADNPFSAAGKVRLVNIAKN